MKAPAILIIILAFGMSGCDTFYGPVLKNSGSRPIEVTACFADGGKNTVQLNPGDAYWQHESGRVVDSVIILQDGKRVEFGGEVVRGLLMRLPSSDQAVILIEESGLGVASVAEVKRFKGP